MDAITNANGDSGKTNLTNSVEGKENKPLTPSNNFTSSSNKMRKSVSSVNELDLLEKKKPLRSSRTLSGRNKNATPVSKSENKELILSTSVLENKFASSKQSPLPGMTPDNSLGMGGKAKSFAQLGLVPSMRNKAKSSASTKDTLFTSKCSVRGQRRKGNVLTSSSYWLNQIKLSESAGKHVVSLGFFKLALDSAAEPLQKLRDELKAYVVNYNVLEIGEVAKNVLQSYGLMEEIIATHVNGQTVEIHAHGEGSLSESRAFMNPIHEMSSFIMYDGEDGSISKTANNMTVENQCKAAITELVSDSQFNKSSESLFEEFEISKLKMVKDIKVEDDNIQEPVLNESSRVLAEMVESKTVSTKTYLKEAEDIASDHVRHPILNQKSCSENEVLNVADKRGSVSTTLITGTTLEKKIDVKEVSKSTTFQGTTTRPFVKKSFSINTAGKGSSVNTFTSTPRQSGSMINNTKNKLCSAKAIKEDKNKGTAPNNHSQPDLLSSVDNRKQEDKDNLGQDPQKIDMLSQAKDFKDSPPEDSEELEIRSSSSSSINSRYDIINMSVDELMGEVVSSIMSTIYDSGDSQSPLQGLLESRTRDTTETNQTGNVISMSTSSMSDINKPLEIVHDAYGHNIGSGPFLRAGLAANRGTERMRDGLEDSSCSNNNGEDIGGNMSSDVAEHEPRNEKETLQVVAAGNDNIGDKRAKVEGKSELNVMNYLLEGSRTVNEKGGLKSNLQNEIIANSNKENIINDSCAVPSNQIGIAGIGKEVKGFNKSNDYTHLHTPTGGTPGSVRRSARLRERATT